MPTYEFYYATENGHIDSVFILAPNRIVAWEEFSKLVKGLEDEVITVDCLLVEEEN